MVSNGKKGSLGRLFAVCAELTVLSRETVNNTESSVGKPRLTSLSLLWANEGFTHEKCFKEGPLPSWVHKTVFPVTKLWVSKLGPGLETFHLYSVPGTQ